MKEYRIKQKAVKLLESAGWVCWCPSKSRWAKESDIFGVYDVVAVKGAKVRFIQWTTNANIRTREKKVKNFLRSKKVKVKSEIWGWNSKNKKFKIINV